MTTLNYFCLVVLCSDKFWCFNFALMMQSYLQEINQIEWEIFFTNKVLTKFFQQKYCDNINVAISFERSFNAIKSHKESVKYREIFWHLKTFENFKKIFGHQQTGENYWPHFKGQLKYLGFLPDMAGCKIWTCSPALDCKDFSLI